MEIIGPNYKRVQKKKNEQGGSREGGKGEGGGGKGELSPSSPELLIFIHCTNH